MRNRNIKKYFTVATIGALVTCSMTACSMEDVTSIFKSKPKNAQELVERFAEQGMPNNYQADIDMDLGIGAESGGFSMEFDVGIDGQMLAYDEDSMYMDLELSYDLLGQEGSSEMIEYIDGDTLYKCEDGTWSMEDYDADEEDGSFGKFTDIDAEAFKDATFEYDKESKTYTIVVDGEVLKSMFEDNEILDMSDMESLLGDVDTDELFEDASVTYVFDKDLRPVKLSLNDFSCEVETDEDVDVEISIDLAIDYSRYGEVEEDEVTISKADKKKAKKGVSEDTESNTTSESSIIPETTETQETVQETTQETTQTVENYNTTDNSASENSVVSAPVVTTASSNIFGTYNGKQLNMFDSSIWDAMSADGWEFDSADGEYSSFIVAVNDKYEWAEAYLYPSSYTVDATRNGVSTNCGGYDIQISNTSAAPQLVLNGVTWGATKSDIVAAWGEPSDYYEGTYASTLYYYVTVDGTEYEVRFVYNTSDGVYEMRCTVY